MADSLNFPDKIEGISYLDLTPVCVRIDDGMIVSVERLKKLSGKNGEVIVAPGLIDIQVNGHSSVSFSLDAGNGLQSKAELSKEDVKTVTKALWAEGVTTYFPAITTNSHEQMLKNIRILRDAMEDPELMGSIPGIHIEGPYISPEDGYRGAHPKNFIRKPDWNEFNELLEAANGKILLVTLAPEIEGAIEFIAKCRSKGIVVSLGHHNGSAGIIGQAIDNGARLATHLGNGCAQLIKRHENPIWPQLADDRLMISMICDGFHLPPEIVQVFYKVKGHKKIILISDITSYAGLAPGEYKIKTGETVINTSEGKVYMSDESGNLYGSASPLVNGVGNIMKITGCSLKHAIEMASTNPARLHNLRDRGKLASGKRADLILFRIDDGRIIIEKTIVNGSEVFTKGRAQF